MNGREIVRATTVLAVRHNGRLAMGGDGQVTMGQTVVKTKARKIRKIYNDRILTGFAGSTADAFTLFEKFEAKIEEFNGNLTRAAVELAKEWRTNKMLKQLEALLLVGNTEQIFLISGTGDVIEPDDDIMAIGSGGPYAIAAGRAIKKFGPAMGAKEIVKESLEIAASICIYTNTSLMIEEI
jgi:ATP-dependent HslUV protease subunit HslV